MEIKTELSYIGTVLSMSISEVRFYVKMGYIIINNDSFDVLEGFKEYRKNRDEVNNE